MEKNIDDSQPATGGDGERETRSFCSHVGYACLIIFGAACTIAAIVLFVCHHSSHNASPYIQDMYVPSLVNNKTATLNTSVFVHLTFERDAAFFRRSYGDFTMILSYGESRSRSIPVGNCTVDGFSMGHKKRVDVKAVVEATEMPWELAFRKVSVGNVAMVVELEISELLRVARVDVDDSGHMVKRPILLEEWYPRWE